MIEVGVRLPGFWTLDQNSTTGVVGTTVEVVLDYAPNPDVIFLGSSRFRNDISPSIVAENLGLPNDRVANVSFSGGTVFDYPQVYRDNREIFGDGKILVVNVGARDFNWGRPSTLGNLFRRDASLVQRIQIPGLQSRSDLVAGWFWKTWDARTLLRGYGRKILKGKFTWDGFPEKRNEFDELSRIDPLKDDSGVIFAMEPVNFPHSIEFHDFHFSRVNLERLVGLVELAHEDGLEVLLLETPLSPPTLREINESYGSEDVLWRQEVFQATGLSVRSVPNVNEGLCADWESCYIDYGHMSSNGAKVYSKMLAEWITAEYAAHLNINSPLVQKK